MTNTHLILTVSLALLLAGCDSNALVDRYHELPQKGWTYDQTVVDTLEITQPEFYHQAYANLRINADYPYQNIYLKLNITAPDGKTTNEVISVPLAENSGKWLGSGIWNVITFQSPILHRKYFDQKGKYRIEIEQNMRLESLPSVEAVGIRVEQQEEIY